MSTFDRFAEAELDGLLRFATVLTGSPDAAADVVQNAMVRAYRSWNRIALAGSPSAYVRRILVNEWLAERRRWFSRKVTVTADIELYQLADPVCDTAERYARRDDINARLKDLPRRQRVALVLRFYLDLDDDEIAEELGCATGTVRSLCSRGLAALRRDAELQPEEV